MTNTYFTESFKNHNFDFESTDFDAEAFNYKENGITDRAEIYADVEECLKEALKEEGVYILPDNFAEGVEEYTSRIMSYIDT